MLDTNLSDTLRAIAKNLRWSWDEDTQKLFVAVDPTGFAAARHNPWAWMNAVGDAKAAAAVEGAGLTSAAQAVFESLQAELAAPTADAPPVAYFCMEYGIHQSFPIYSGGLGILAGDHVKAASDMRLDFVALGLLYPDGYLAQGVDADGNQLSGSAHLDRASLPLVKLDQTVTVGTPVGDLHADVWEIAVGRTRLLLLDPDVDRNTTPALRQLCSRLYGGDRTTRIRQELLLGVGGMGLLYEMGLDKRVFHLNEGHCAFALLEAARRTATGDDWQAAVAPLRARTVFTTHTPVPAGHDRFGGHNSWAHLNAAFKSETFSAWARDLAYEKGAERGSVCMTVLALNLSDRRNGVAKIHGGVSRKMWKGYEIGHVTNGVPAGTWVAPEVRRNPSGSQLWAVRKTLRGRLVELVRQRLLEMPADRRTGTPENLSDNILTVGFARRFAPYKRATLLLQQRDRLAALLTNPERPVQILYAGKAHPADVNGQRLMKLIVQASKDPAFGGRIHFVPDYDIEVGGAMVKGADVWLNTPRRPLEASGTSGQKAGMNGGLNLSVPDGWWPEGYDGKNGWVVAPEISPDAPADEQDVADVESVFSLLESEVAPLFYDQDADGISQGWLAMSAHAVETLTPKFSARRMLEDYVTDYYKPAGASLK